MRVRTCAKVHVVKILRTLPIEEYAAIAMTAGILGALHAKGQNEIRHLHVLDERNVPGAAHLGLVVAVAAVDAEHRIALHLAMRP